MKIIASYAESNPKINLKKGIYPKGIIVYPEQNRTGSAFAVAQSSRGPLAEKAYHYICGEGIVYAVAVPIRYARHARGTADEDRIGVALVLPKPDLTDEKSEYAEYRLSEAKIRSKKVCDTAAELLANLCSRFHLNPKENGVILSRKEAADLGLAEDGESIEEVLEAYGEKVSFEKIKERVLKIMNTKKRV